jgi:hypothetical protein
MSDARAEAATPPALTWPFESWLMPLVWIYVTYQWWQLGQEELERSLVHTAAPADALRVTSALLPVFKVAGFLAEAAVIRLWWRAQGRALPYWRFASWLVALSIADLLAHDLAAHVTGGTRAWAAVVAGLGLVDPRGPAAGDGLRAGFGGLGALTLARIGLESYVQSRVPGIRFARALLLTCGLWLATRIAIWWSVDLASGMSRWGAR